MKIVKTFLLLPIHTLTSIVRLVASKENNIHSAPKTLAEWRRRATNLCLWMGGLLWYSLFMATLGTLMMFHLIGRIAG